MRAFLLLAVLAGCDGTISVTISTGPQEIEVSADSLAPPPELRDGSGRIASVPCGPSGMCPPSDTLAITCEAGACDPGPTTIGGPVGGVIDVQMIVARTREVGVRRIESYEVEEVVYDVRLNTLSFDVGPIEVYWGPEAAAAIDPALGVRRFGTVPRIVAGTAPTRQQVAFDTAGSAELSSYLVNTAPRVRFFAQTVVDLDPGDPFPEGTLRISVEATITAVGRVL